MENESITATHDGFDGYACISGQLLDKSCEAMTDQELADFIKQGAWRRNAQASDESAYQEAARRLRKS